MEWYRLCNPYIVPIKIDPLAHFLANGRKYRLSPSRKFDSARYLNEYETARISHLNPLVHYLEIGRSAGLTIYPAPPSAADRITNSGLFDADWYLDQNLDVKSKGVPPLLHYMVHGANEGRSPGPNFDSKWYLQRYNDIAGMDPLLHYIDHGRDEGRIPKKPVPLIDLAKEIIAGIEDLDPDLYSNDYFVDVDLIHITDGYPRNRVARSFETLIDSLYNSPHAIIFLPWIIHGGADLVASHAIRALSGKYTLSSLLVVFTDHDREEALHLIPDGAPQISFSRIDPKLSNIERAELVSLLIRGLQPHVVLNINSHACWEATKRFGRQLTNFSRLYAMLFCPDFSSAGRRSGYADLYIRDCLSFLTGVYFDNQTYINELIEQFHIPADLQPRLTTVYQPIASHSIKEERKVSSIHLKVLWAGRLTNQKNVKLLIEIAIAARQFEFHIWGRGDQELTQELKVLSERYCHIFFSGPFESFDALPLADYDAFLYTSLWDGIPNVLLEASNAQLPIVAPDVGGVSELVDESTGWLVTDIGKGDKYIEALEEIAANPRLRNVKLTAMSERLKRRHNWEGYLTTLSTQPSATMGILDARNSRNGNFEWSPRGNVNSSCDNQPNAGENKGRE